MEKWDYDWMLEPGDKKEELMKLNKNIKLDRKMPEPLQSILDNLCKAYDQGNVGMYTLFEDEIESETKIMLNSKKITKKEKELIFSMLGWYVDD